MKKRYPQREQEQTVMKYLLGVEGSQGRRPSEAAMEVGGMSKGELRKFHRRIVTLLDAGELAEVQVPPDDPGIHERGLKAGQRVIRKKAPAPVSQGGYE